LAALSNFTVLYDTPCAASAASADPGADGSMQLADEWLKRKNKIISAIQATPSLTFSLIML
jgi:hypothetical protein